MLDRHFSSEHTPSTQTVGKKIICFSTISTISLSTALKKETLQTKVILKDNVRTKRHVLLSPLELSQNKGGQSLSPGVVDDVDG